MQTYVKHLGYKNNSNKGSIAIKSHIKYIEQRVDEKGLAQQRELYNNENNISRIDFYNEMDKLPKRGVLAHKLIISMDRDTNKEQNIDLKELTRRTINIYEQKHNCKLNWIATNHEGKNPHSHIVVLGKDSNNKNVYIMPKNLTQLKKIADKERTYMHERNINRLKLERNHDLKLERNHDFKLEQKLNPEIKKVQKQLQKQENEVRIELDRTKRLKEKLKIKTSKVFKDLDNKENKLEKKLEIIQNEKELNHTFENIDNQLKNEQEIEENLKPELTNDLKHELSHEIQDDIKIEIELEHER